MRQLPKWKRKWPKSRGLNRCVYSIIGISGTGVKNWVSVVCQQSTGHEVELGTVPDSDPYRQPIEGERCQTVPRIAHKSISGGIDRPSRRNRVTSPPLPSDPLIEGSIPGLAAEEQDRKAVPGQSQTAFCTKEKGLKEALMVSDAGRRK
jgi:hypothetical protein